MVNLKNLIKNRRYTMESVINATRIHRTKFYLGLKQPGIFKDAEIRAISKATGIPMKEINELK